MSQENVEIVRSAYAEADPLTSFAERVAPDAEFDYTDVYPDRPVGRGIAELRRFRDKCASIPAARAAGPDHSDM